MAPAPPAGPGAAERLGLHQLLQGRVPAAARSTPTEPHQGGRAGGPGRPPRPSWTSSPTWSTRWSRRTSARSACSRSCSWRGGRRSTWASPPAATSSAAARSRLTDVLGDQNFTFTALSVPRSSAATTATYINLGQAPALRAHRLRHHAVLLRLPYALRPSSARRRLRTQSVTRRPAHRPVSARQVPAPRAQHRHRARARQFENEFAQQDAQAAAAAAIRN